MVSQGSIKGFSARGSYSRSQDVALIYLLPGGLAHLVALQALNHIETL